MEKYYASLELPLSATLDDIKRAYRRLAKLFHPDVSAYPDARERFIAISEAYEYLNQKLKFEEQLRRRNIKSPEESAQVVIDEWLLLEQERIRRRAAEYASMKYRNYKNTEVYRATRMMNHLLLYIVIVFGVMVIAGSVFGTWRQYRIDPDKLEATYLVGAFLIFIVGAVITTFTLYYILHHRK